MIQIPLYAFLTGASADMSTMEAKVCAPIDLTSVKPVKDEDQVPMPSTMDLEIHGDEEQAMAEVTMTFHTGEAPKAAMELRRKLTELVTERLKEVGDG